MVAIMENVAIIVVPVSLRALRPMAMLSMAKATKPIVAAKAGPARVVASRYTTMIAVRILMKAIVAIVK